MRNNLHSVPPLNQKAVWAGRIVSTIAVVFLLFDSTIKLMKLPIVLKSFADLGYPSELAVEIGIVLLVCVGVYLIPQTSILGAIVLTGYLGGAVATQLRVGNPLLSNVLFPIYVGVLVWLGLYLREPRLRVLVPWRQLLRN
jgi:hypothetical protein